MRIFQASAGLIELLRPQQWYKNLVVFIAIIFSSNLFSAEMLWKVIAAFFLLSLASGANYIINDLKDLEKDRLHPTKKYRPLPSGKVPKAIALTFAVFLLLAASYFSYAMAAQFFYLIALFFALGTAYTFILKDVFLVDIITISVNFVLRAIMGAVVIGVSSSTWLIVLTFLFALVLAATKRKGELYLLGPAAVSHRKNLESYNAQILDFISIFSLTSLFISYSIYAIITKVGTYFAATIPLVIYIIFKYMAFIMKSPKELAHPERFLFERSVLAAGILLAIMAFVIFYLPIPQIIRT